MRIVNVLEATVPLSRYADPATAPGDLDTSVVAVLTDVMRGGRPVVGLLRIRGPLCARRPDPGAFRAAPAASARRSLRGRIDRQPGPRAGAR